MKNISTLIFSLFLILNVHGQSMQEKYQRAEKLMPANIRKLVLNENVQGDWMKDKPFYGYIREKENGFEYMLVDAKKKQKSPAFDHALLAKNINSILNTSFRPDSIPLKSVESENETQIKFRIDTTRFLLDLKTNKLKVLPKEKQRSRNTSESPDKKWEAFVKDHNLFVRSVDSEEKIQLTEDGIEKYEYALDVSWYSIKNIEDSKPMRTGLNVFWSPNSKKIFTIKPDRRKAKNLYMFKSLPDSGFRAEVHAYERALPGETELTMVEYYIFDMEKKTKVRVDIPVYENYLTWGRPVWSKDESKLFMPRYYRGFKRIDLLEINVETGKTRTIISESSDTYVDPYMAFWKVLEETNEFIWQSESDGWSHLYLYDLTTGKLKNQITKGEYVVRSVEKVDEKNRLIYYMANGKEPGDPYLRHFYSVDFSGEKMQLLTPEFAEHSVSLSSDNEYFIDSYSRIDMPTKTVLRRLKDGKILLQLEEANATKLFAAGWKYPEPFKVKARDGKTDIYGVMYKPSDFDPSKTYPVIDDTYSGPHTIRSPKSFDRTIRNDDLSLAELGFIVVTVDGLGSAFRSKAFHDYSYQKLGDGCLDHVYAIKQLGENYSFIDTSRVGIFGHSAGGYDAAHALLVYPDFYKVAVSSAGNHDHRMSKIWWPELYMGYPVGKYYDEQSNLNLVNNLKGKLLLVHGDMDNNVNPANTLRLAAELVKANKDFDLLIIPNNDHIELYDDKYFNRKRWDYFVKHLMGTEPPKEYKIGDINVK